MANKELKGKNSTVESEGTTEENGGRRSFMKGMVAGSVAVGTLASSVANAAPSNVAAGQKIFSPVVKPRPETAKLKITFDQRQQPKLIDLQRVLEEILVRAGCPNCGLGGIDV